MTIPRHIKKRDGTISLFNPFKIRDAVYNAVNDVHKVVNFESPEKITEEIHTGVMKKIENEFDINQIPEIKDIHNLVIKVSKEMGYSNISQAYEKYKNEREEVRNLLSVSNIEGKRSTTDAALLIESDSKDTIESWDRAKIVAQLEKEANLAREYAERIAKEIENSIVGLYKTGIRKFNTTDIRVLVDLVLRQEGLEAQRRTQALLGMPTADFESIVFTRSNENSNIASNNPEAVNLEVAERIQKPWALNNIFSEDVAKAHLNGQIHLHDLGYPTRAYCSSHSIEYIKKYGLNKVLKNLESKSNSPNSASVLNQHIQTFLASMQAHYAGALGFGFLNILYSSLLNRPVEVIYGKFRGKEISIEKPDYDKLVEQGTFSDDERDWEKYFEVTRIVKELREVSQKEFDQTAQNLIFAASQNAFSRGGQTLFIDFNLHTGVPSYLRKVPAIGPKGKYMIQLPDKSISLVDNVPRIKTSNPSNSENGDADDSQLSGDFKGGKIIKYGDLESTAQRFCKSMLKVWKMGDKDGRPFHFPKCDLHVDKNSFSNPIEFELLEYAVRVASENGCVYFMFDRGDGAVLAQCCRLKERIEDTSMLKYPERLRFCGFQNVTINLAQASYRGKNLEGTLKEITKSMDLAFKAHFQKKDFMQKLLDTDGSPMRNLGISSDDGKPYIDLDKSTFIIGNIGLNEAVEFLTGNQLHESEEAYKIGLYLIAHMYIKIQEFKSKTGLKFTIEETPAESTTRRLALVDRKKFPEAEKIIKGNKKDPYYTNSIHFAPAADVGIVDRIVGQSRFHDMIESGAIIHAYVGEQRPEVESIMNLVKKTLFNTKCSQLVFSPTYTECDACGNVMAGEKNLCTNPKCINFSEKTVNKESLNIVTKIVGYNSRVSHWNNSQKQIYEERKKAEEFYAGFAGKDMSWLYNPDGRDKLTIIEFSKSGCPNCVRLKLDIEEQINYFKKQGKEIEFKIHYLDKPSHEGLVDASMYDIPLDTVPAIAVIGKKTHWKKIMKYGNNSSCEDGVCSIGERYENEDKIKPEEIKRAIEEKISEFPIGALVLPENDNLFETRDNN